MGWKEVIEYWKASPVERRKLTLARKNLLKEKRQ